MRKLCKFGLRFYPVFVVPVPLEGETDSAPIFQGFELSKLEAEDAARKLARDNPGAIAITFSPEEAFEAGERPIRKTFLEWPKPDVAPAPPPAPPAAEPPAPEPAPEEPDSDYKELPIPCDPVQP